VKKQKSSGGHLDSLAQKKANTKDINFLPLSFINSFIVNSSTLKSCEIKVSKKVVKSEIQSL